MRRGDLVRTPAGQAVVIRREYDQAEHCGRLVMVEYLVVELEDGRWVPFRPDQLQPAVSPLGARRA